MEGGGAPLGGALGGAPQPGGGGRGRAMGTREEKEGVVLGAVVEVVDGGGLRVEGGERSREEGGDCHRG